jgi:hypothetical protein
LNRVADAALVAQADLSKIWHPQWGDFVERTQAQGALSETKMRQYLQHIPVFALKARPSIQHGHPLPFEIVTAAGRAGSNSHYGLVWTTNRIEVSGRSRSIDELVSDDASLIGAINDSEISYANRFGELAFTDHLSLAPWEPMLEGPQTLKVFLTVDVTGPAPLKSSASMIKSSAPTTLDVAWTLLPRGTLAARLVHDDSLRPVVENSLRLPRFNREFFDVQCSAPINLAYDVFARSGSREYRLGTMLYRGKSNTSDMTQYSLPPDLKGDRADVIFRPSLDAAETTVDIQQIWDGEVVIKDVPIKQ